MPQLFLDCDGVLADFDRGAEPLLGSHPRVAEKQLGTEEFWRRLRAHPGFFSHLELMPDAMELFEGVRHLGPVILTGCPAGHWSQPQKHAWAAHHFPGTPIITCQSRNKRDHMRPGDILVDDFLKYRHLWEEAGGVFVHHKTARETLKHLESLGVLRVG